MWYASLQQYKKNFKTTSTKDLSLEKVSTLFYLPQLAQILVIFVYNPVLVTTWNSYEAAYKATGYARKTTQSLLPNRGITHCILLLIWTKSL